MVVATVQAAPRPREFVGVIGRDAAAFLQRMLTNDVLALVEGEACEALLLTPASKIVAPLVVWRRGADDFLLLTEPRLGATVRATLLRARLASRCAIEPEEHTSTLVLGGADTGVTSREYGVPAVELLDAVMPAGTESVSEATLERLRILARAPRWGAELDSAVLPAEAGLDERAISFTKGCFPGQEPVVRLRHRGHVNRSLRVLALGGDVPPGTELTLDGKRVGRVTSIAPDPEHGRVALAYVRREVPAAASLDAGGVPAKIVG
ncbi:MAG: hypothetical protein EXQ77_03145 [Thermoleophilia bacterium]|nr:hypothetical protein [Thermoleophilia bacterium]